VTEVAADVVTVSVAWAPLALLLVVAAAWWAACLDAVVSGGRWGAPAAEAARLLRQRRRTLLAADRLLWRLGGGGLLVAALLMVAVIPLGRWTLSDLGVGVVWFNAMDVLVWALVWMAGWGANSTHALVGGYRFLAQALAYELPLMFALTAPAVGAGSLRVADVIAAQHGLWFVVWMPVAFVVFCACVVAFSVQGPFAAAAAADIGGGVLAEVSGVDRLLLLAGRYALLAAGSAFAVVAVFGGGDGPWLPDWVWTLVKTFAVLSVLVLVRRRVPLLRPDRLVEVGWVLVLPLTLLQLLVVSVVVVVR